MTTFDKREDAFENRFALDEELKFRAAARRDKQLGLWAAGLLGKSGDAADAYVSELLSADFQGQGDENVFLKIRQDFDAAGVAQSDHQIRRTMDEVLAKAIEQIRTEG